MKSLPIVDDEGGNFFCEIVNRYTQDRASAYQAMDCELCLPSIVTDEKAGPISLRFEK